MKADVANIRPGYVALVLQQNQKRQTWTVIKTLLMIVLLKITKAHLLRVSEIVSGWNKLKSKNGRFWLVNFLSVLTLCLMFQVFLLSF